MRRITIEEFNERCDEYIDKVALAEQKLEIPADYLIDMWGNLNKIFVECKDDKYYGIRYTDNYAPSTTQKIFGFIYIKDFVDNVLMSLNDSVEIRVGKEYEYSVGYLKKLKIVKGDFLKEMLCEE